MVFLPELYALPGQLAQGPPAWNVLTGSRRVWIRDSIRNKPFVRSSRTQPEGSNGLPGRAIALEPSGQARIWNCRKNSISVALYQGTTSVVPPGALKKEPGFSPDCPGLPGGEELKLHAGRCCERISD
jgi:hypothetical protein